MGVTEIASGVTEGLKSSPIALSLVVVNVIYLAAGGFLLMKISERSAHRDDLIVKLAQRDCAPAKQSD